MREFSMEVAGNDPASGLYLDRKGDTGYLNPARVDVYAGGHFWGQVTGHEEVMEPGCGLCGFGPAPGLAVLVPAEGGAATAEDLGAPPRQAMPREREQADRVPLAAAYRVRLAKGEASAGVRDLCSSGAKESSTFFNVTDTRETAVLATMEHVFSTVRTGCCAPPSKEDRSTFFVGFPPGAPPGHRAVLLAAAFELDYRIFQDPGLAQPRPTKRGGVLL